MTTRFHLRGHVSSRDKGVLGHMLCDFEHLLLTGGEVTDGRRIFTWRGGWFWFQFQGDWNGVMGFDF